ncbi:MAG: hypothetical protein H8E29_02160 [Anaerolineales bacterium]|uniref:Uncharacterized protein n=1 Tax=Candidatus Desulfolinea nitratireducens TaxID=2841698 RepID=A0A8J6NIC8_9CHLR|nr:hypothetical protein [Candidatus Desulfolinea nitratireducens]
MSEDKEYFTIKIVRRPWYEWILWGIWLFLEIVFLQSAIASHQELEQRAAMIYWLIVVVLSLTGFVFWIIRRSRLL